MHGIVSCVIFGGMRSKLYGRWCSMKNRCYRSSDIGYKHYGGRGIRVADEWLKDFSAFESYVLSLPNSDKGLTLDRINNDGNYEKGNLRWVNMSIQIINRRKNKSNTSGYVGVRKTCIGKWAATVGTISLGEFFCKEDALYARNEFIIETMQTYQIQEWVG